MKRTNYAYLRRLVAVITVIAFLATAAGAFAATATNLSKADAYFAKGNYKKALEFYKNAINEYKTRLGKTYSNLDSAGVDAAKLAESEYKAALAMKKTGATSAAVTAMFKSAAATTYPVKQGYYEKTSVLVPGANSQKWIPETTKQVLVDGHYEDVYVDAAVKQVWIDGKYQDVWIEPTTRQVWVDAATKQVWVDAAVKQVYVEGYYKEVWVDPYYRQDGTYVKGYYRKQWVDGHYENKTVPGHYETQTVPGYYRTETVPGRYEKKLIPGHYENQTIPAHYEKKWVDAYYRNEVVPGHNETVWIPEHYETKEVYKTKTVFIPVKSAYVARAQANLPRTARRAADDVTPAAPPPVQPAAQSEALSLLEDKPGSDQKSVEAYNAMKSAYQSYMKAGFPAEGPEFEAYKAAAEAFKNSKR